MKKWQLCVVGLICLAGCANVNGPSSTSAGQKGDGKSTCIELSKPIATRLGIIRQMLAEGKPHAAIAYLDDAGIDAPQAQLLRADALRQTGRGDEAARRYRQLINSCVAGYAYQGLGLIAFSAGRGSEATAQLRLASEKLPTDSAVRNDYGYALMLQGDDKAALHEFLTAIELSADNRRAARNLLLLLTRTGEEAKLQDFAKRFGIGDEELTEIRSAAQQLPAGNASDSVTGMTQHEANGLSDRSQTSNDVEVHDEEHEQNLTVSPAVGADDGTR